MQLSNRQSTNYYDFEAASLLTKPPIEVRIERTKDRPSNIQRRRRRQGSASWVIVLVVRREE